MNKVVPRTPAPSVAMLIFLSFAAAYFPSALVRSVIATLAPAFGSELNLSAAHLGLLAGAYFLGFAVMQLPLGSALDRLGPKRVSIALFTVAIAGCAAFALARDFTGLVIARAVTGVGVSACLMAPMTSFRRHFTSMGQMRASSWIMMTGSLGQVAATLPVQWLVPVTGWRGLFWILAAMLVANVLFLAWALPRDEAFDTPLLEERGYGAVFTHPTFIRYLPMGLFNYGALLAVQSLWAGPWLTKVCGWTAQQTATGLFTINLAMLGTFMAWGVVLPKLYSRGCTPRGLMAWGTPLSLLTLSVGVVLGEDATAWTWALFCATSTFTVLCQPAVGQAFSVALAGRALSAFNLVIFSGIFALQWSMGAAIDVLQAAGWSELSAFRGAFALMGVCCLLGYLWFLWRDDAQPPPAAPVSTP